MERDGSSFPQALNQSPIFFNLFDSWVGPSAFVGGHSLEVASFVVGFTEVGNWCRPVSWLPVNLKLHRAGQNFARLPRKKVVICDKMFLLRVYIEMSYLHSARSRFAPFLIGPSHVNLLQTSKPCFLFFSHLGLFVFGPFDTRIEWCGVRFQPWICSNGSQDMLQSTLSENRLQGVWGGKPLKMHTPGTLEKKGL